MRRRVGSRASRRPEGSLLGVRRTAVVDGCSRSSAGVASRQCGSNQAIKPPGPDLAVRNRRRTFAVVSERLGRHGCLRGVLRQRCLDHREVSVHADVAGGRDPVDREAGVGSSGQEPEGRADAGAGQWALACTSQPAPPHGSPLKSGKRRIANTSVSCRPRCSAWRAAVAAIDADDAGFDGGNCPATSVGPPQHAINGDERACRRRRVSTQPGERRQAATALALRVRAAPRWPRARRRGAPRGPRSHARRRRRDRRR